MKEIFKDEPFPYMIIDNFISRKECDRLIEDASLINTSSSPTHGGRTKMFSSSDKFKELIKNSQSWQKIQGNLRDEVLLKMAEYVDKQSVRKREQN